MPPTESEERTYTNVPAERLNERWISRTEARGILQVTPVQFQRLIVSGEITEYRLKGQTRVYDPTEIEALVGQPTDDDSISAPAAANINASTGLVRQAQGQVERLVSLVVNGHKESQRVLLDTIKALSEEVTEHRKAENESRRLLNETKWSDIEREVVMMKMTNEDARRQQIVESVTPHIAPILSALSVGIAKAMPWMKDPQSIVAAVAAQQARPVAPEPPKPAAQSSTPIASKSEALLRSIGIERLTMLAAGGVLDDEDNTLLRQIIDDLSVATPQQPNSESEAPCAISTESPTAKT